MMKTIYKITSDGDTQIFEIITSRKELREWMRSTFWDSLYSQYKTGTWDNEDETVDWIDKDGNYWGTELGDTVKRPNIANIKKMISSNDSTTVIYGDINIIYNERYGDWETDWD